MDMILLVAAALLVVGISLAFNLTATQIADDVMNMIRPTDKLRTKVDNVQENKRKTGMYAKLMNLRNAMEATGRGKTFPFIFLAAIILAVVGGFTAFLINNIWLFPSLVIIGAVIPFIYASSSVSAYNRQTKQELETALSIITNAYVRTDNIVLAVQENLNYIKPPLQNVFKAFIADATFINSNTKAALYALRDRVDDQTFYEWVTTLIQCQDDRTMKDNLQPIVSRLTDIRMINEQMMARMAASRTEYYTMVGLVVANIPLLLFVNKDWFDTLMFSTPGKITQGICALAIVVTFLFCRKFTQPLEYKG